MSYTIAHLFADYGVEAGNSGNSEGEHRIR